MKPLFAPWRSEFVGGPKKPGCPFCQLPKERDDRRNLIVARGKFSFLVLNRYPYNAGHLLIVPYIHTADFAKIDEQTLSEMAAFQQKVVGVLTKVFQCEGFNIGMNLGLAAGAGIPDHLHYHVLPRWVGDTNFLPIVSQSKVINQDLAKTYDALQPLLG